MSTTKDRDGTDLMEAEDIKKRRQEYTEELYKKHLHDPYNHDALIMAAKNIINLTLVLTIWCCPCVEPFLVLLEEGACYDQYIFLAKLH